MTSERLQNNRGLAAFLRRWGTAIVMAIGLVVLYYVILLHYYTKSYIANTDFYSHIRWALHIQSDEILSCFTDGSEHLWHVCVKLLFMAGVYNPWKAAGIVTGLADAIAFLIFFKAADEVVKDTFPRWLLALAVSSVFIVSALTVPGGALYVGVGGVNVWHNPTTIMVRPFAAAVFCMTARIYNRARFGVHALSAPEILPDFVFPDNFSAGFRTPVYTKTEIIFYPLCLFLSAYAKPSFLQMFAPAIFVFLLIDLIRTKGRLFPFCVKLAIAYIPAAIVLCSQLSAFFGNLFSVEALAAEEVITEVTEESGIAVYFLSENFSGIGDFFSQLVISLKMVLLPSVFPLFIFALSAGKTGSSSSTSLRLGTLGLTVSWLEASLLHETGERASHGNFFWAEHLAAWLLWGAAISRYCSLISQKTTRGRLALYVGTPLLVWHLTCGIIYLTRVFSTGVYLL